MSLVPIAIFFTVYANNTMMVLAFPAILLGFVLRVSEKYVILLYLVSAPFIIYFVMVIQMIMFAIVAALYRTGKKLSNLG